MSGQKIADSQERPSTARRALLTGGVAGLAAVAGTTLGRVQPASAATTNPSITDWVNVVTDVTPGADPTGNTDSYGPIQAAINAAAALPNNGVVYFPVGTYLIQSGLLLLPGVVLMGPHPYAQDYWAKAGAVLTIGGSFTPQAGYPAPAPNYGGAAIGVFDQMSNGSAATAVSQCGIYNLDIEGGSGPGAVDGIAAFGPVDALNIRNVSLHDITGNGIAGYRNNSGTPFPDGWCIANVAIINAGSNPLHLPQGTTGLNGVTYQADGLQLAGNDHSLENVHSQGSGTPGVNGNGNGFNIAGSNIRCSRLRADSSGLDGFLWASVVGGGTGPGSASTIAAPRATTTMVPGSPTPQALARGSTTSPSSGAAGSKATARTAAAAAGASPPFASRAATSSPSATAMSW